MSPVSNSISSFLYRYISYKMGGNSKFLFKKCSCGEIKRGGEFKRHINKYKNTPHFHEERAVISGCTHCLKFLKGKEHEEFYIAHADCPLKKANNYITSDIGKVIAPFFNEETVDLDAALQEAIATILEPAASATTSSTAEEKAPLSDLDSSDDSDSEEVVITKDTEEIGKPTNQSSPKKKVIAPSPVKKGIKQQTNSWNKDTQIAKVSQEYALTKLKDELTRYKNECSALRDDNFHLKGQVAEIRALKTQVINLESFRERALASEKRVTEQATYIKSLKAQEEVSNLKIEQLKTSLTESQKKEERRTTLHIPIIKSRIVDSIILESEDLDSTFECYEGAMAEMRCLHVSIKHDGEIKELRHRKRKLPAKYLPQPSPSKGSRTG